MRILHTSDWHLGRTLEGRSRLCEQQEFLNQLCDMASSEDVDVVLVAGDVFDSFSPPAAAEELYYDALERLSAGGTRAVIVIAGNHDSPDRIHAANPLAIKHGISLVGYPGEDLGIGGPPDGARRVRSGRGWFEIYVPKCGESVFLATLAYPSESRLNQCLTDSLDDRERQVAYSDKIAALLRSTLSEASQTSVRLVVAHLYTAGGWECDSERQIQLGGALAVQPSVFADANYVALGHLHRPQEVAGSQVPCRYSGSPLAYSFSEADQQKEVVLVDVNGLETRVSPVKLTCGKPLKRWESSSLEEVLQWCRDPRNQNFWVDLELTRDQPLSASEIDTLRKVHPGLVNIRWRSSIQEDTTEENRISSLPLVERFKLFCQRKGIVPDQELVDLFLELVNRDESEVESGEAVET